MTSWSSRVAAALLALSLGGAACAATALPASAASDRYALGDSVMLGAKTAMKALGFGIVDAVKSRQSYSGPSELRHRGASLPRNVVIHLGTNGSFPLSVCKAMVDAAGPDRRVFLVTVHVPRSWERADNQVIRQCASSYAKGRVTVVDWDALASRHPQWLYSDGTHLKSAGARGYARLIDQAIRRADGSAGRAPGTSAGAAAGAAVHDIHGLSGTGTAGTS